MSKSTYLVQKLLTRSLPRVKCFFKIMSLPHMPHTAQINLSQQLSLSSRTVRTQTGVKVCYYGYRDALCLCGSETSRQHRRKTRWDGR